MAIESDGKNEKNIKEERGGLNRRQFLGVGVATGIALAAANSPLGNLIGTPREVAAAQIHDDLPMKVTESFKRFNSKNTVFNRGFWDPKIQPILQKYAASVSGAVPPTGEPGYTTIDYALYMAAWSVDHMAATNSEYGIPSQGLYDWNVEPNKNKTQFASPEEAAVIVKKAALFLGASLVGITDYDERWVYSDFYNPMTDESIPADFPFKPKSVVVIAIEMDFDAYRTGPSMIAGAATGLGYSKMAETTNKVATFIRQLGYAAAPCGNDTALSVPLAIMAGLGECGRNSILITKEFGPRVRLCKVFTELQLKADKPITFGVKEFCRSCKICAESCPSEAISMDDDPTTEGPNISNCNGIEKWYTDAEKCFQTWADNTVDCCNCITSCPYNKPASWHHDLTRNIANTPLASVLSKLDTAFGFGKTYDEKVIKNWWKK